MQKIKELIFYLIPLVISTILFGIFLEIKLVISVGLIGVLIIGYMIYKEKIGQEMLVAFLMSLALTSYYYYEYTTPNLIFGGINLFPLVCFTFGLVLLREIYERINIKNNFILITLIYWICLFALEFIGYSILNIRVAISYPSLFNLGIIHGPLEIKIIYLILGPVYILVTDYLMVK